jgi:hypothetical protein
VAVGRRQGRCVLLLSSHLRFPSNGLGDPDPPSTAVQDRTTTFTFLVGPRFPSSLTSLPTRESVSNRAMTISASRSLTAKPTLPISPASSTAMGSARDGNGASPDASGQAELRRVIKTENGTSSRDDQNDGSSNSEEPTRKRRRSRKGLEKRFECSAEGCGKSYSRAEHL